jgi:glutamine synthetase
MKDIFGKEYLDLADEQMSLIKRISDHIRAISKLVESMREARKKANKIEDLEKRAHVYCDKVKPFTFEIREHCDKLELLVDDELWPMSKYREILFTK